MEPQPANCPLTQEAVSPPKSVVPYKFPSLPWMRLASGAPPSDNPENEYKVVRLPEGVSWKMVPQPLGKTHWLELPPPDVTP